MRNLLYSNYFYITKNITKKSIRKTMRKKERKQERAFLPFGYFQTVFVLMFYLFFIFFFRRDHGNYPG